jgi:hypothetical protein
MTMTEPVNTSTGSIMRWARELEQSASYLESAALDDETAARHRTYAATLRHLVAERDALRDKLAGIMERHEDVTAWAQGGRDDE